jgi:large subunit ribosomal protein L23
MILIKPIITEKAMNDAAHKRYTFKVKREANKSEIKKAVEKTFGVKVTAIQTMVVHGKKYRVGKRWLVKRRADWKKAILTIQPDKQIDLFEVKETGK